ncbi:MAG: glutamate 5-kinase [Candidatus Omnitrophota bacterium]
MKKGIIVVKVGTAVLTKGSGRLNDSRVRSITAQICKLLELGYKVILVSSGAIGAGMEALRLTQRPKQLAKLQACAAIGQGRLMKLYEESFRKKGTHAAQILLTQEDFTDRKRFLNAKNTILSLLNEFNSVPVINENDTIATDEIRFGDNDRLSSLVANLVGAHTLIMLTDVDGLCSLEDSKKAIPLVPHISACEGLAKPTKGKLGTGGMICKLDAAKMAVNSGITCIIANGTTKDILLKIENKEPVGTTFLPASTKTKARKSWLAFAPKSKGSIIVDSGAKNALVTANKSLLPAGIKDVSGKFQAGDVVSILGLSGEEFAKGVTRFSSDELDKIKGLKTTQIENILKRKITHNEVIHRDNLVILQ